MKPSANKSRPLNKEYSVVLFCLITLLSGFSTGCAHFSAPQAPLILQATGTAFLDEPGSPTRRAASSAQTIDASACGFPSPDSISDAQKRLTAIEAARYRALAQLIAKTQGLNVTQNSLVKDLIFAGEEISISLSGTLKGSEFAAEKYDPETEMAEVQLRLTFNEDGEVILPNRRRAPESLPHRKAEAEAAARINAAAALRERTGQIFIAQNVEVTNHTLSDQQVQLRVDGWLQQIHYSAARWLSESQCEVTASVEIAPEELKQPSIKRDKEARKKE